MMIEIVQNQLLRRISLKDHLMASKDWQDK
jgi:hypothetical protein